MARIAREHPLDACVHFAAFAYVGESVTEPARYFDNNFTQAQVLFESLVAAGVKRVVFSSTCATYGVPTESADPGEPRRSGPINPYGWSKLFVERLLDELRPRLRPEVRRAALLQRGRRHRDGESARRTTPRRTSSRSSWRRRRGARRSVSVFGNDYDTPDGTCIRDYIHVEDLGEAHLLALAHLRAAGSRTSSTSATATATPCSR